MLPRDHPAASWALGGGDWKIEENLLENLGDALTVAQVMSLIQAWSPR
jgi:hypothetical protein